jgi:high-affinity Fe2+/Pb2+ permease
MVMNEQPMSLRDTAKGVAVRAGVLSVGGLVVGAWIYSMLLKLAGDAVRWLTGILLMLIAGGLVTWEVKKAKDKLTGARSGEALGATM